MKHILPFNKWLLEKYADDYPKNSYIELSSDDVSKYADEIIKMIVGAYVSKGGHHEFKNADDIRKSDIKYWITNDIDEDPEADIVLGGKQTDAGTKLTVAGQDGSQIAKKNMLDKLSDLLKTRGFYAEMDISLAQKIGLSPIRDEKTVRRVINKNIVWNNDGSYDRKINGVNKTKILVGIPK